MATERNDPRQRITRVVESWSLTEPLLFAAWTMHDIIDEPRVTTIRIGRGRIEYNADFIRSLRVAELPQVLAFETMRILLGHPYSRRKPQPELSYAASNLSVQECLRTSLPIPRPRDLFGDPQFDNQYFEFYYRELSERSSTQPEASNDNEQPDGQPEFGGDQPNQDGDQNDAPQDAEDEQSEFDTSPTDTDHDDQTEEENDAADTSTGDTDESPKPSNLTSYCDPAAVGMQNTASWDEDDLLRDEITLAISEASQGGGWGTLAGYAKAQLLATLKPPLDYRGVLRRFRQSVLSIDRKLTRMKPSRRYGFDQMGSRYDFTTKLLMAVDVSGSITDEDLQAGFSIVNRFFQYGVREIDVIAFDTQIQGKVVTLRRAKRSFDIVGRGGTDFQCVIDYIETHRDYDGMIIFTDGQAPVPTRGTNRRTRILWLFNSQKAYAAMNANLRPLGQTAFLKAGKR